ncbi:MAG: CRTAC1 family protein [Gemmatimonadota bacterium]|nr:CRTAC1 family protein [Gemmatimonadota bacterium]
MVSQSARSRIRFQVPVWGLALASALCACAPKDPPAPPVHFADASAAAGIDFVHYNGFSGEYYYVETFGAGAAFLDYDGDGRLDLYLANGTYLTGHPPDQPPVNRLYRNAGAGTFADVTAHSGSADPGYGFGVAAADYDADGDPDLFVANYGPNALYRNDQGTFAKTSAGLADPRWGSSAGFLDYDLDGDLDLFVANYVRYALDDESVCQQGQVRSYCEPSVYDPTGDLLYRNDGNTFTDVTEATGITLKGKGLGVALADYDRDGDTDIYVANDGTMNFLYANQHSTFAEVGLIAGTRYNEHGHADAGMGVDFGDYDRDGDTDLFVSNFAFETNALYRNDGQGQFAVATQHLGLADPSYRPLGFGTKFFDYDNDGDLDLFAANGHVIDRIAEVDSSQTYRQPNQMFRNDAGRRFADISATMGPDFQRANAGRATAVADYDDDGDLDLLVTTVAARPRLLRNDGGNASHWLQILLVGKSHPDALGTRVEVVADGIRQVQERQSGGSYLSSHDPRLHFGLGAATSAQVEIYWPDGTHQIIEKVATNQVLKVVQPTP